MDEVSAAVPDALSRLRFEPNTGQEDPAVLWTARTPGGTAFLEADGMLFVPAPPLRAPADTDLGVAPEARGEEEPALGATMASQRPSAPPVRLVFPTTPRDVTGEQPLESRTHVYAGDDPSRWATGLQDHGRVRYHDVAPGIDVVVYGVEGGFLEFDHVLAPGADPGDAFLSVQGAEPRIAKNGALQLGDVVLQPPYAYQQGPDGREPVEVAFDVRDGGFGYDVGAYDAARPLVIDPVQKYGSYLGTGGSDHVRDIEVRDPGIPHIRHVYVTGEMPSGTYPGSLNATSSSSAAAGTDVFVARFSFDLQTRWMHSDWFTYLGGGDTDSGQEIDLDPSGRVAVIGQTMSTDFPTMNPIHMPTTTSGLPYDGSVHAGGQDIAVLRLDASGAMEFSSFMGASGYEYAYAVATDGSGMIAFGGGTNTLASTPFPTINAYQPNPSSLVDAFVTLVDPSQVPAEVRFSTYMGGPVGEYTYTTAMDGGDVYAGGLGSSGMVFTPGSFDPAPDSTVVGWAARFQPTGDIVWATGIDGDSSDAVHAMAIDAAGNAWLAGTTSSTDFPVCPTACVPGSPRAIQGTLGGSLDAFLVRLSADGTSLDWGTYWGGESIDYGDDMDLDTGSGRITVGGETWSGATYPSVAPPLGPAGSIDHHYVLFDTAANVVLHAANFGGSSFDAADGVALDDAGNVYVAGETRAGFATLRPIQGSHAGGSYDGTMAVLGKKNPTAVITADASAFGHTIETTPLASPYTVLTAEDIGLDGLASLPGDDGLDPLLSEWELLDSGGSVVDTFSGGLTPTFTLYNPVVLADDGLMTVCLTVYDTSPPTSYDRDDTACMDLEWKNRPPVPVCDGVPTKVQTGVPTTFLDESTDVDGTLASWSWDFSDGGTASVPAPVHTFADAGTYTVELTVKDDDGAEGTVSCDIEAIDGPIADFDLPTGALVPRSALGFVDRSTAGAAPITTWTWDWGDTLSSAYSGSVPTPVPHTYAASGTYAVTLTVDDGTFTDSVTKSLVIPEVAPQAKDDAYVAVRDTVLEVDAPGLMHNDLHPLRRALTVTTATAPTHGTLAWNGDGSFTYTPPDGYLGPDAFSYTVSDGTRSASANVSIEVVVSPPPVADFQPRVFGDSVHPEDRSFASHEKIVSWTWTLDGVHEQTGIDPVFQDLQPGRHVVELVVTDAVGLSDDVAKDFFIASAAAAPLGTHPPPVAMAELVGEARSGNTVYLDGSASGDVHHEWTQLEGPRVALQGADDGLASFTVPHVDEDATFVFRLRVYDGISWSEPAWVSFFVEHENRPPVLDLDTVAGTAAPGSHVVMEADATDPDGDDVEVAWSQVAGPPVAWSAHDGGISFRAPEDAGEAVFRVTATDGVATSSALQEVLFTGRVGPEAYFRAVVDGAQVRFLDARPGLSYEWDFGDGSEPAHERAPVHAYAPGLYLVGLVVTDDQGRFATMQRQVEVPAAPQTGTNPVPRDDLAGPATDPTTDPAAPDTPRAEAALPATALTVLVVAAVLAAAAGIALALRRP